MLRSGTPGGAQLEQPSPSHSAEAKCVSGDGSDEVAANSSSGILSSAIVPKPCEFGKMWLDWPGVLQKESTSGPSTQRAAQTEVAAAILNQVVSELRSAAEEHRSSRDAFAGSLEARCAACLEEVRSAEALMAKPAVSESHEVLLAELRVLRSEVGTLHEGLLREIRGRAVSMPLANAPLQEPAEVSQPELPRSLSPPSPSHSETPIEKGTTVRKIDIVFASSSDEDLTLGGTANDNSRISRQALTTGGASLTQQLDEFDEMDKERGEMEMQHIENLVFSFLPENVFFRIIRVWVDWFIRLREPARVGLLAHVVSHSAFEFVCVSVITWNAFFAAYVADWEIQNLGQEPTSFISTMEFALLCFYLLELLLRFAVHRAFFFVNDQWRWNIFDVVLVIVSAYDQRAMAWDLVGLGYETSEGGSNVTFMRAFRLAKLGKVMRLFRVFHFCQDLRLMLLAIERSLISLFWCLCLLAFVLYIFGLVLQHGVTQHLVDIWLDGNVSSGDEAGFLNDFFAGEGETELTAKEDRMRSAFGSMALTTLSLYKATTGGADWGEYYNVAASVGLGYGALFIFYTAFFTFTVMNILTGMIVENVVKMTQGDDECLMLAYRRQQKTIVTEIERLFSQIDRSGVGTITFDVFMESLQLDQVRALLNVIELDIKDAEWFFNLLLSVSDTGTVDVSHFVDACSWKLKGSATSVDLQCVSYEVRLIRRSLAALHAKFADAGLPMGEGPHLHPRSPAACLRNQSGAKPTLQAKRFESASVLPL